MYKYPSSSLVFLKCRHRDLSLWQYFFQRPFLLLSAALSTPWVLTPLSSTAPPPTATPPITSINHPVSFSPCPVLPKTSLANPGRMGDLPSGPSENSIDCLLRRQNQEFGTLSHHHLSLPKLEQLKHSSFLLCCPPGWVAQLVGSSSSTPKA